MSTFLTYNVAELCEVSESLTDSAVGQLVGSFPGVVSVFGSANVMVVELCTDADRQAVDSAVLNLLGCGPISFNNLSEKNYRTACARVADEMQIADFKRRLFSWTPGELQEIFETY